MRRFEGFEKGINLGGWLSQFNDKSEEHFLSFIKEDDIKKIAEMGFDHVRIPVDYILLEDEEGKSADFGYELLHNAIKWAKTNGINVLIDLHEIFGYSFDPLKKDIDREKFFYDAALQKRFQNLWRCIAKEFGNDPSHVAFELLNEVVVSSVYEAWNNVVSAVIPVIREYAPYTWIVVGGVRYNNVNSVPLLDKPVDDRVVYNFHCYEPLIFTHQQAYWVDNMPDDLVVNYPDSIENYQKLSEHLSSDLVKTIYDNDINGIGKEYFECMFKKAVDAAEKNNVPLYCGEYGVIDRAKAEDTMRWISDIHSVFQKFNIGHALWNYKEKDFGFMDHHLDAIRNDILATL